MVAGHQPIEELSEAILEAARGVATPVQRLIVAPDQREMEIQWLGIAFESLSFYIVLATKMAQTRHNLAKAQQLVNALGGFVLPEIEARFFSKNPPEMRSNMIRTFQAGHYEAERHYGGCTRVCPKVYPYDADSVVSRFAHKLLQTIGKEAAPEGILATIFDAIKGPSGAPKIFFLVDRACDAMPS